MNLEEAKANIGKEVVLDESTLPYTDLDGKYDIETCHEMQQVNYYNLVLLRDKDALISTKIGSNTLDYSINIKHLKLKEQPMNYKIRVTPETSKEVQELFFALGGEWCNRVKIVEGFKFLHLRKNLIQGVLCEEKFNKSSMQEITLPQLRDMVVLKRNDVSDATHTYKNDHKEKYYIGHSVYRWNDSCWKGIAMNETYISGWLELIGADTQMTWQDALRAVADDKEVEFYSDLTSKWHSIETSTIGSIKNSSSKFRIAPQRITLHNSYTKEELLKIAGEME